MDRRKFLALSAGVAGGLSGCTQFSTEDGTPADADGDGVPDRDDYAPRDASVQSKSDAVGRSGSDAEGSRTRRVETTATTTTVAPTPTPTPTATNSIRVDTEAVEGRTHHFVAYSLREAELRIYHEILDNQYPNGARVVVTASTYPTRSAPRKRVLGYAESDLIHDVDGSDIELALDLDFDAPSGPFYLQAMLLGAGTDVSEATSGDVDALASTDRLTVSGGRLRRDPSPLERDTIRHDRYERINVEGEYLLRFTGGGAFSGWSAGFTASKVGHVEAKLEARTYDYAGYARTALDDGTADALGSILNDAAEANGFTGAREKVEFLIDFVQSLPYVPDDVSSGRDEYPKYVIETLVEAGGDCEDSSILLASLLRSASFGYGTVLLLLPGHMAVGVKGADDLPGSYYEYGGSRYYYVETTGEGWNVGEIPAEYQEENARILSI